MGLPNEYEPRGNRVYARQVTRENAAEGAKEFGLAIREEAKPGDPTDVAMWLIVPMIDSTPHLLITRDGPVVGRENDTNVEFAKHSDGRMAVREDSGDGLPWRTVDVQDDGDWYSDQGMAAGGWVPVPTRPTITESQADSLVHRARWAVYQELSSLGIEVVPDPKREPTNAERLAEVLIDLNHPEPRDYARLLDEAGVTAPGGER